MRVDENGEGGEAKVKAVTMRKSLKEGIAGTIENLDPASLLLKAAGAGGIAYLGSRAAQGDIDLPF